MKPVSFFILLLLFPAFTLTAQDTSPIRDKPGTWTYGYLNDENTKMYSQQFVIISFQTSGPHYSYDCVKIKPLNSFKVDTIQYSKIKTSDHGDQNVILVIPRIYNNGDSIFNTNTFNDRTIEVTSNSRSDFDHSSMSNDKWINCGTKYIVLKKEGSLNNEYCWIKVNVTSYNSIKLLS